VPARPPRASEAERLVGCTTVELPLVSFVVDVSALLPVAIDVTIVASTLVGAATPDTRPAGLSAVRRGAVERVIGPVVGPAHVARKLLEFAALRNIRPEVELFPAARIDEALESTWQGPRPLPRRLDFRTDLGG
jgi:D-arabinose 1-dehydrogenase-like Zn-dependent alcohol dehydrogenase